MAHSLELHKHLWILGNFWQFGFRVLCVYLNENKMIRKHKLLQPPDFPVNESHFLCFLGMNVI